MLADMPALARSNALLTHVDRSITIIATSSALLFSTSRACAEKHGNLVQRQPRRVAHSIREPTVLSNVGARQYLYARCHHFESSYRERKWTACIKTKLVVDLVAFKFCLSPPLQISSNLCWQISHISLEAKAAKMQSRKQKERRARQQCNAAEYLQPQKVGLRIMSCNRSTNR